MLATIRSQQAADYNKKLARVSGAARTSVDTRATNIASGLAGMERGLSSRQAGLTDPTVRDAMAAKIKADRARIQKEKEEALRRKTEAYIGIGTLIVESGVFNNLVNRLKRRF